MDTTGKTVQPAHCPWHPQRHPTSHKKLWFVFAISISYMVAEVVGGFLSGSLALFADAGHMAVDSMAIALSLFAAWFSQKPPTAAKTYGFHRVEILAALINGAVLLAVSVWIFVEAWQRFVNPPPVMGKIMLFVAAGGLVVNLIALSIMHDHAHQSLNARSVWLHLLSDTLGSVSALIASFFIWKFNWFIADPIISIILGLLILRGAWSLLAECVNVLLEGVPSGINVAEIKQAIESVSTVREVHDLHVWTLTSGVPALSVHVIIDDASRSNHVLNTICQVLRDSHRIDHVTIQVEPPDFLHRAQGH